MKIKKDDNVMVISGKDRGKTGKVLLAMPKKNKVVIAGVNVKKRHQRATKANQKGQKIEITLPIDVSNVMLVEDGKPVRISIKREAGKRIRISRASGKTL